MEASAAVMWVSLSSQQAIDDLMKRFIGFHDGCLREVAMTTETYVDERGAMTCPDEFSSA